MPLDPAAFWKENALCLNRPFSVDKPRCPLTLPLDDHWLLDEMRVPSTLRYYREPDYALHLHRLCNDRCENEIGLRPFRESPAPKAPLRIEELFSSRFELTEGATPWLESTLDSIDDLMAVCSRLEKLSDPDLRSLIFSNGGQVEPDPRPSSVEQSIVGAYSRGPATIATSVIGTTRAMFWLVDFPSHMHRFFECLAATLIRYQHILERERRVTFRGYGFLDDNCALLSPDMYEEFCFPVLQKVFAEFAPNPADHRYQHSDSAMAHLLPILSRLNFSAVNFGPTLSASLIRSHMPRTEIHGQVAPMTLRNSPPSAVEAEVLRDFSSVGSDGGLLISTAGSIPAGTPLPHIRSLMSAVHSLTRYHP